MFRVHACGLWDLNVICENLRLITLRSQLEVCEKESSIFFPVALRRPPRLLANPWPLVNPRPGVRMFRSRRRRVSRQASPFLSLPHHEFTQDYLFPSPPYDGILQAYQTDVGHRTRVLQPKGGGGLRPILDLRRFNFPSTKGSSRCWW